MHFERALKVKGSLTAETDARPTTQQTQNSSKQCMIVFLFRRVFKRVVKWQGKRVFIKKKARGFTLRTEMEKKLIKDDGKRHKYGLDYKKKARGFTLRTEMEKKTDKGRRTKEKDVSMDWTIKKKRVALLYVPKWKKNW